MKLIALFPLAASCLVTTRRGPTRPFFGRLHRLAADESADPMAVTLTQGGMTGQGERLEEDRVYLEQAITGYLDNEWIPQPCHADIGRAVGKGYVEARIDLKFDDLTSVMMHIGSVMESTDMGDAFVGSDLIMARLGRELCDCVDPTLEAAAKEAQAQPPPSAGVLTPELVMSLREMCLKGRFDRYSFLAALMDEEVSWVTTSAVVALAMGFRVTAEGEISATDRVDQELYGTTPLVLAASSLNATANSSPIALLENALPEEDTDERDALRELLYSIHGDTASLIGETEGSDEFLSRSIVLQWLAQVEFLNDDSILVD